MIRFRASEEVQVVDDAKFMNMFDGLKFGNALCQSIEVLQTCTKAKTGCGQPIFIQFLAPIDENGPEDEEINYDYKSKESDYDLLKDNRDMEYAEKQCLKYCYYIQKVRGFEVLSMKAEFFKDHNGWIWFYYAQNIHVRQISTGNALSSEDAKEQARKLQQTKEQQRKQMIHELEMYEAQ